MYGGSGSSAAERLHRKGVMELTAARKIVQQKCTRPMLHARTLGFRHPATGEEMDFAADPPADFEEVFRALTLPEAASPPAAA